MMLLKRICSKNVCEPFYDRKWLSNQRSRYKSLLSKFNNGLFKVYRTQSDSVKLSMSSTLWKKVIIFFPNSQINTVLDEQLQIVTFKVKTNTFCCRVQTEGRSRHLRPSVWSYFRRRFQVWMCGGQLMIATCSHVGHVFRKSTPYTFPGGTSKIVNHNNARLAEVWLDDWKEFYFSINPGENNAGDLKMIA